MHIGATRVRISKPWAGGELGRPDGLHLWTQKFQCASTLTIHFTVIDWEHEKVNLMTRMGKAWGSSMRVSEEHCSLASPICIITVCAAKLLRLF